MRHKPQRRCRDRSVEAESSASEPGLRCGSVSAPRPPPPARARLCLWDLRAVCPTEDTNPIVTVLRDVFDPGSPRGHAGFLSAPIGRLPRGSDRLLQPLSGYTAWFWEPRCSQGPFLERSICDVGGVLRRSRSHSVATLPTSKSLCPSFP